MGKPHTTQAMTKVASMATTITVMGLERPLRMGAEAVEEVTLLLPR